MQQIIYRALEKGSRGRGGGDRSGFLDGEDKKRDHKIYIYSSHVAFGIYKRMKIIE